MTNIAIEWMDGVTRIYHGVIARAADADTGQLTLSIAGTEAQPNEPRHPRRVINVPLSSIRWWGQPEPEQPLVEGERERGSIIRIETDAGEITELRTACGHSFATCHTDHCFRVRS